MQATVLSIDTLVPRHCLSQDRFAAAASDLLSLGEEQARLLERITKGSRIQKRYFAVPDFSVEGSESSLYKPRDKFEFPGSSLRNQIYKENAPKLAETVCRKVLDSWGGNYAAITHVILVSCTGMIAPGIEFLLLETLGLSPRVERLGINSMGCFGAFKGLAIAKSLAKESPQNRVLMVCVELCSLHFQSDFDRDAMVASSLFADGAAAAVIGVEPRDSETPLFELHNQGSEALGSTRDLMTWEAGDSGYRMRLSPLIPAHLESNIAAFAQRIVGETHKFTDCSWAVHPGGKAILEAISRACHLENEQLSASWRVLSDYGNMSSPTFLFVLKQMLSLPSTKDWIVGLGFGPGLSFEGLLLKRVSTHVAE